LQETCGHLERLPRITQPRSWQELVSCFEELQEIGEVSAIIAGIPSFDDPDKRPDRFDPLAPPEDVLPQVGP
jgi:hypothetical protein